MSMTERGVYITLLCQCWLDNGLSTDLDDLAADVGMKRDQFQRIWKNGQIAKCFVERGGKLHNDRLDLERRKQSEYRRRQADNGSKGGRPPKSGGDGGNNPPVSDSKAFISSDLVSSDLDSSRSADTPRRAPLVTPPAKHANIAFFTQIGCHVPRFLHDDEFRPKLMNADSLTEQQADSRLMAWYSATEQRYLSTRIGDKPVDFWRKRFAEWQGTTSEAKGRTLPAWARKAAQS